MRGYASAGRDLPLAVVAALTTWCAMWSWRGFSADPHEFLGPLLVVAVTVSLGGVALRSLFLSERAGVPLHVLVALVVVWLTLGGSVLHPLAASHDIVVAIRDAWLSAATNPSPVPGDAPSIAPVVIVYGAGVLLLVDVLACQLGRVSLAGLPLVAVYAVPIIGLDVVVPWPVFAIPAVGFLLMVFLHQSAHVSRWGRPVGLVPEVVPGGGGERAGVLRARAALMGAGCVLLAVTLPAYLPTAHLKASDVLRSSGHGDSVRFSDLMTTMRRGLHQGKDVPLLDVVTDDPHPSYLRLGVDTRFDGERWTSGSRDGADQVPDGPLPIIEEGLNPGALDHSYDYTVTATSSFDSTWLPTQFPASSIDAPGSWSYAPATMDVFAGDSETNAAGITYRMTAVVPRLSSRSLADALPAPPDIVAAYTASADSLPAQVYRLAVQATRGAHNPYRMAVRLQDWFRNTGGFRYDLDARSTDDDNALVDFLTPGPGGQVGYCEQFASAYAAMAQVLGIPARVAVGFLNPTPAANHHWIYSARDYHAWPELYFQGSGWVRFEPTPAARGTVAPTWTTTTSPATDRGSAGADGGGPPPIGPTQHAETGSGTPTTTTKGSRPSHSGNPRAAVLEALGVLVVLAMLVPIPGAVRRSRRTRRLAGGAEDAWAELRDTAVDLGLSWPVGRSPHETGVRLLEWFAAGGPAPDAEPALDRIVLVLEQVRYAPAAHDDPVVLAGDVRTCIQALEKGRSRSTLVRARWLPRSVVPQVFTARRTADRQAESVREGRAHDLVG